MAGLDAREQLLCSGVHLREGWRGTVDGVEPRVQQVCRFMSPRGHAVRELEDWSGSPLEVPCYVGVHFNMETPHRLVLVYFRTLQGVCGRSPF